MEGDIWVTRTAPDNRGTCDRLAAIGCRALAVPMLEVRALEAPQLAHVPEALVFTSAHGVRHHAPHEALFDLSVFAVGDRTASAARESGYCDVRSANGDYRALQQLILEQAGTSTRIVHFCARETAGDLRGFLSGSGYMVEQCHVYETVFASQVSLSPVREMLSTIGGILLHSPKGARGVAAFLRQSGWRGRIWCISEACTPALQEMPGVDLRVAAFPTESALLEMVGRPATALPGRGSLRLASSHPPAPSGRFAVNDNRWVPPTPPPDRNGDEGPPSAA